MSRNVPRVQIDEIGYPSARDGRSAFYVSVAKS
jgi:hypothetical protein